MPIAFHEKYVIDENGERVAVIIDVKNYAKILQLLEEAQILENVREGEKEYRQGKLKPINSVSDLDR